MLFTHNKMEYQRISQTLMHNTLVFIRFSSIYRNADSKSWKSLIKNLKEAEALMVNCKLILCMYICVSCDLQ